MTPGLLRGIEEGWFMSEIAEAAFQYQIALEKGDKKVVGVNCHTESVSHDLEILRVCHEVEVEQVRAARPSAGRLATTPRSRPRWTQLVDVARTDANMIPAMLDAVRAEATLGEICDALREEWGGTGSRRASRLTGLTGIPTKQRYAGRFRRRFASPMRGCAYPGAPRPSEDHPGMNTLRRL